MQQPSRGEDHQTVRRSMVAFTAAVALLLPAPTQAAVPESQQLDALTTLQGDVAGSLRVHVPRDTEFYLVPDWIEEDETLRWDFDIGGDPDGFAGFLFVPDEPGKAAFGAFRYPRDMHRNVHDGRFPTAGADQFPGAYQWYDQRPRAERDWLPAGDYELYLLTEDGVHAEVELRLAGLDGAPTVTPTRPSSTVQVERFSERLPSPDPDITFTGGEAGTVHGDRDGFFVLAGAASAWLDDVPGPFANLMSLCHYRGGASSDVVFSAPFCIPQANSGPEPFQGHQPPGGVTVGLGGVRQAMYGRLSVGGHWFTVANHQAGVDARFAAIGVWASLD